VRFLRTPKVPPTGITSKPVTVTSRSTEKILLVVYAINFNNVIVNAPVAGAHRTAEQCVGHLPKPTIMPKEVAINPMWERPRRERSKSRCHAYGEAKATEAAEQHKINNINPPSDNNEPNPIAKRGTAIPTQPWKEGKLLRK